MEQLEIQLMIHKIKLNSYTNNDSSYRIRISIGDKYFYSAQRMPHKNIIWFNEKNYIQISKLLDEEEFVTIEVEQNGNPIGQKLMFLSDFISRQIRTIQFQISLDQTIKLEYAMIAVVKNQQHSLIREFKEFSEIVVQKKKKIDWLKLVFGDHDVQILNGGQLIYKFAQRLDAVHAILNYAISFFTWKNPYQTLILAIIISLILINIRIGLIGVGFLIIFMRKHCMQMIRKWKVPDYNQRFTIPTRNIVMLQTIIKAHIFIYDEIFAIISSKDRKKLVHFFDWLTFIFLVFAIALLIIDLTKILVLFFWVVLAIYSPYKTLLLSLLEELKSYLRKFVPESVRNIIFLDRNIPHKPLVSRRKFSSNNVVYTIVKQFSIFEYERWWLTNWLINNKKPWSDSTWTAKFDINQQPPSGWRWIDNWTPVKNQFTDEKGYTYANDFDKQFNNNRLLGTIRRRQYIKRCILQQQNSFIIKQQHKMIKNQLNDRLNI